MAGLTRRSAVTDVRVDDSGVFARCRSEVILDVYFDGRRIFSFWLHRDGSPEGNGHLFAWPGTLRQFLDGRARITIREHDGDQSVFDADVHLGEGDDPISITSPDGRPIALDKSLRRVQTFDLGSEADIAPLMSAIEQVLTVLNDSGVAAFLAYGTLLGAVRDGKLIGHDSDADLGYVSRHQDPVDVARESFLLQRALAEQGHLITRYSTAAFKVEVIEASGTVRGLDVFGGFLRDGKLHLMGEIRTPFRREWIEPLGQATLEGWSFPVPADTDRFLAATYGPSWRVPDPAFHFATPASTHRRFNGWFRGIRTQRALWDRTYASRPAPNDGPSDLARWVAEREPDLTELVDMGCGTGGDVLWFARRGVNTTGFDFVPKGFEKSAALAEAEGLPAQFHVANLLELRSSLSLAALVAATPATPQPRVLMARHVIDSVGPRARRELWRMAQVMLSDGGRLHLQFMAAQGTDNYARRNRIHPRRPGMMARELEALGATIVEREVVGRAVGKRPPAERTRICRMVVQWQ